MFDWKCLDGLEHCSSLILIQKSESFVLYVVILNFYCEIMKKNLLCLIVSHEGHLLHLFSIIWGWSSLS